MESKDLQKAIQIISEQKSVKVSFNVPVNDSYSKCYDILIHESNAMTIDKLVEAGYNLSMCPKGLIVNKY